MRYTLWSHGCLVGHTDLDIHTVTPTMRQGFIEPTPEGAAALRDATGVMRTMAEDRQKAGTPGYSREAYLDLFQAACERREAVEFELRDEQGEVFECEYMRVYDLREMESQWGPASPEAEAAEERELQAHLESLSPEDRAELEASMAADEAMIAEWLDEMKEDQAEEEMYHSSWPPPPAPDERWETMQYHLQVFLKGSLDRPERSE
jgi:hypothetical protein